jgi:DNA-binding response OmpR family regulator
MNEVRILLAEDDGNLGTPLKSFLNAKNYDTTLVRTGTQALDTFLNSAFNICIFDTMLPKMDGITLAKEIRLSNNKVPIIFISAKKRQEDIIDGFVAGADDYITRPFSMEELYYRIEAILRRTNAAKKASVEGPFTLGSFKFDPLKQILSNSEKVIKLTTKESELLSILYLHRNELLERNHALKAIWIDDNYFNARSMDVYISKLRKYISEDPALKLLNVHGKGYKLIC